MSDEGKPLRAGLAWSCFGWDGSMFPDTVARTRRECITRTESFVGRPWPKYRALGFRIVAVLVSPAEVAPSRPAQTTAKPLG